ncbi:MAG: M48 family metalloprotease [bacterium]
MAVKSLIIMFFTLLIVGCLLIVIDLANTRSDNSKYVSRRQPHYTASSSAASSNTSSSNGKEVKKTGIQKPKPINAQNHDSISKPTDNTRKEKDELQKPDITVNRNPDVLSQNEQIELGNEVARKEKLDDGIYIDNQIDRIAKRLISNLPEKYYGPSNGGWQWIIRCKRTPHHEVNAVSLMGGRIYVYDGILKLTHQEDELAAVLAHEIIHIVEEHSAEQIAKTEKFKRFTMNVVDKVKGSNKQSAKGKITEMAGVLGCVLIKNKLSRNDEYQADEKGFQLLVKAGYNSEKALIFFNRIQKLENSTDGEQGMLGQVFSTHPPTKDRIANLQSKIPTYTKSSIDSL